MCITTLCIQRKGKEYNIGGNFKGMPIFIDILLTSIGFATFSGCTELTIYAEATSKPGGWAGNWNSSYCPVYWYSETENTDGHHWHYDTDGVTPVIW